MGKCAEDYLYALCDALVSINVPNDEARAVVDAMERDMGTTIATKSDLQLPRPSRNYARCWRWPRLSLTFRNSPRAGKP